MPCFPRADSDHLAEIDERLADLWETFFSRDLAVPLEIPEIAAFMRAAYGKGYYDALSEPEPGEFLARHGLPVPISRG